jgi:hypothetical protein
MYMTKRFLLLLVLLSSLSSTVQAQSESGPREAGRPALRGSWLQVFANPDAARPAPDNGHGVGQKGYFANDNYIRMEGRVTLSFNFAFVTMQQQDSARWDCPGTYTCASHLVAGDFVRIYGHVQGAVACPYDPPCSVIVPDYIYLLVQ